MNRLAIAAGVAGLGYFGWKKLRGPTKNDYQAMDVVGPGGTPIKIATPVSNTVTVAQATGTPTTVPSIGTPVPVPTTVPGKGVTYAPPGTITTNASGDVLQPAPILITQLGASSIAIGSVKDVQHALNTLGYASPPLVEDGKLGPLTNNAIKAFQNKNRLVVDGNAGPATKAALSAALTTLAGGASAIGATMQNSSPQTGVATTPTGAIVDTSVALKMSAKDVQHALNLLGTSPKLDEDGNIGPKSVAAIKTFQAAHGLTTDGVAGPKTKSALYMAAMQVAH